jgi:hypothetical protein
MEAMAKNLASEHSEIRKHFLHSPSLSYGKNLAGMKLSGDIKTDAGFRPASVEIQEK